MARLFGLIPPSDLAGLHTIVLRQPTRKQAILSSAWGRLRYRGELRTARGQVVAGGPMILFEAVETPLRRRWPVALPLAGQAELERLRADGQAIDHHDGGYTISVTLASARATQLFRTLPHEVGHWFDWLQKVESPSARGAPAEVTTDRYFARPAAEREAFAHRYADILRKQLIEQGAIPFDPV